MRNLVGIMCEPADVPVMLLNGEGVVQNGDLYRSRASYRGQASAGRKVHRLIILPVLLCSVVSGEVVKFSRRGARIPPEAFITTGRDKMRISQKCPVVLGVTLVPAKRCLHRGTTSRIRTSVQRAGTEVSTSPAHYHQSKRLAAAFQIIDDDRKTRSNRAKYWLPEQYPISVANLPEMSSARNNRNFEVMVTFIGDPFYEARSPRPIAVSSTCACFRQSHTKIPQPVSSINALRSPAQFLSIILPGGLVTFGAKAAV